MPLDGGHRLLALSPSPPISSQSLQEKSRLASVRWRAGYYLHFLVAVTSQAFGDITSSFWREGEGLTWLQRNALHIRLENQPHTWYVVTTRS